MNSSNVLIMFAYFCQNLSLLKHYECTTCGNSNGMVLTCKESAFCYYLVIWKFVEDDLPVGITRHQVLAVW